MAKAWSLVGCKFKALNSLDLEINRFIELLLSLILASSNRWSYHLLWTIWIQSMIKVKILVVRCKIKTVLNSSKWKGSSSSNHLNNNGTIISSQYSTMISLNSNNNCIIWWITVTMGTNLWTLVTQITITVLHLVHSNTSTLSSSTNKICRINSITKWTTLTK